MWVPNLVRYSMARAEYDSLGSIHNPYIRADWEYTKLPARLTGVFLVAIAFYLAALVMYGNPALLAVVPLTGWAAMMVVLRTLPERYFYQSKIRSLFSIRTLAMMRINLSDRCIVRHCLGNLGDRRLVGRLLAAALGCSANDRVSALHGAATNRATRQQRPRVAHQQPSVLMHPFINFAVFPLGQDYHLPHHMFSTIPTTGSKNCMSSCRTFRSIAIR